MNLGERIYHYRTGKNMSQGDLADALEVSRQSVSKWENNTAVPELDKIVKMATLFGVSLDTFVTGAESERKEPEPAPSREPEIRTVYVEKPVPMPVSGAKLLGGALLAVSLVLLILLTVVEEMELGESVLLLLPVIGIGLVCLTAKQPLLWSLWCGWIGYWMYLLLMARRWESQIFWIILGVALAVLLLLWTIRKQDRGEIKIPGWAWAVVILLLLCGAALLIANLVPMDGEMVVPVIPILPG